MIRRWAALAVCLLLFAAGCRKSVPPPPAVPIDPNELETSLAAARDAAESVQRYQAMIRIRGKGPDGGFSGRLVVLFERPDHLRIELLGAFGATRWSAVADPDGMTVVFPGPKQYLTEADTADIVGRLLGVRLGAGEVMALLAGVGAPLGEPRPVVARRRGATREAELADGTSVSLGEDDQVLRVEAANYRASYPTPWKERRRQIPDRLVLETPSIQATLTVESVDVNVPLDREAFVPEIPEGAERLRPSDVAGEAVFVVAKPEPPGR